MTQIFFIGSSSVYGAGGECGGWADLVKQALHKKMYSDNGVGEKYEIYNLGKSGATIDFVQQNFPEQLKQYGRDGKIITIVYVGGNNAKAINQPDNFVSTLEEYSKEMSALLDMLKNNSSHVIAVGSGFYDESKTSPKISPFNGQKSYFNNQRKRQFESRFKELCDTKKIIFIEVDVAEDAWKKKFLYKDGLHPNKMGHELISKKVLIELEKLL